ncbi:unnamed protein product [Vicia faba]|uniref:DNA-directed DNA polymerase n=1 Tax=Vicia faba TaxID=3906 RepID=A0AAV0YN42_VICFA|nr:unnamed protein product [Vicia faba]
MAASTQATELRQYCPLCCRLSRPLPLSLSSRSSLISLTPHRRKIKAIQIGVNGFRNSVVRSNCVRTDLWCPKLSSVGLNKYDTKTRYEQNLRHKNPVCDTFMKFSSSSTSLVEEMIEEEELSSLRSYEMQVRKVGVAPCNPELSAAADSILVEMTEEEERNSLHSYETRVGKVGVALCNPELSTAATERKLSGGDKRGWSMAKNKLAEDRKEMKSANKFETKIDGSQVSNRLTSVSQIQGFSTEGVSNLFNESALEIAREKIPRVDVDDVLEETTKDSTDATFAKKESTKDSTDATFAKKESTKDSTDATFAKKERCADQLKLHDRLCRIYEDVLVVDNIPLAEEVVKLLTVKYQHLIYACDTEVAKIDVKQETPVDHGEITCFSIYGGPEADFGGGKSCIWVDILDGGGNEILEKFADFFSDPSIKKVWHNYSFDCHVIENYGFKVSGFHADTMHMARLWDSSRQLNGGYSLEKLSGDKKVMSRAQMNHEKDLIGKVSMKTIFSKKKVKKDGTEGKAITITPVEDLQRDERIPWICYSALDAKSTLNLYESLKSYLSDMPWKFDGVPVSGKTMYDFYNEYWRPFGEILVQMETEGMLVDRSYLAGIEKVAKVEQEIAEDRFRKWACRYCPDAKYMNIGSEIQLRQLLFGGTVNRKNSALSLPTERIFKVPNVDGVIEEGKKAPKKFRNMKVKSLGYNLKTEMYTASGWPSISGDALKVLAGKISSDFDFTDEVYNLDLDDEHGNPSQNHIEVPKGDNSAYGTAFAAFPTVKEGREACHAIASLCEVSSIKSLISNFILPLQGHNISGKDNRVHCSLNINTETGRLSARRPNLQNQPALEKDRYKIRQAFIAAQGNSLIVADYGQLELRILAHLANCKSMMDAFKAGGDFHSRTAMNMYPYIREAVEKKEVLLEWDPQPGEDKPPVPLLKDAFGSERRKAKMLNFSIAYGKTPVGLSKDWRVSVKEAKKTVDLWYNDRKEVLKWQEERKKEARTFYCVYTLLGRARKFPLMAQANTYQKGHIERAAINTPVQGSAADVAMCAMIQISNNKKLKELGWKLLLQVHDEVILEGPTESAEIAKSIVVECMSKPFYGKNILKVDLSVDAKCAQNWYSAK